MRIENALSSFAEICYKPLGERGEDAFAYNFGDPDIHAQAVFDGCGGAGAWKYPEFKNATGAFVSAQTMAKQFAKWAKGLSVPSLSDPQQLADGFRAMANQILLQLKDRCAPMGVAGSLVKSFPCTASIAISTCLDANTLLLTALNAGDSRVYCLAPESGLVQLTRDDSRGNPDPLKSLRDSAPLSNLLNADKPFRVSARQVRLKLPCAILCATDGAFGYLRSPMDFEHLLLKSIVQAKTVAEFESAFEAAIREITGDDSTCILSFYGWNSYDAIRTGLKKRLARLDSSIRELDACGEDRDAMESAMLRQWELYKRETVYDEMREQKPWNGSANTGK